MKPQGTAPGIAMSEPSRSGGPDHLPHPDIPSRGVPDEADPCPRDFVAQDRLDHDADGCRDELDDDDDDDGVADDIDRCPLGELAWTSTPELDHDSDGCRDGAEDEDDDNDGVADTKDTCPQGILNWTSNRTLDQDRDGCLDATEDSDDDNDGVADTLDTCPATAANTKVNADGCPTLITRLLAGDETSVLLVYPAMFVVVIVGLLTLILRRDEQDEQQFVTPPTEIVETESEEMSEANLATMSEG